MKTISAPTSQLTSGAVIYQITLASGMIITTPFSFGEEESIKVSSPAIVTDDGRVLSEGE
jgi:hypothetical protein